MAVVKTKEKNIISLLLTGKQKPYKVDINTGIIYGLRDKPVKTLPTEVKNTLLINSYNYVKSTVDAFFYNYWWNDIPLTRLPEYIPLLKVADTLDSLKIKLKVSASSTLDILKELSNDKNLLKEFITFCNSKKRYYNYYSDFYNPYMMKKREEKYKIDFDNLSISNSCKLHILEFFDKLSQRQVKSFIINFIDTGYLKVISDYKIYNLLTQFEDYCNHCDLLDEKVTLKTNFIEHYSKITIAYKRQKKEIDQKLFSQSMDSVKDKLSFTYGDFSVVIPKTPQDIKDEGKNMHHCVADYCDNCFNPNKQKCYIVFVRKTETPEKCYITCQVMPNGKIKQYYLSHDRKIKTKEDIEFYKEYQKHLNEMFNGQD